jgi:hypothetical protein
MRYGRMSQTTFRLFSLLFFLTVSGQSETKPNILIVTPSNLSAGSIQDVSFYCPDCDSVDIDLIEIILDDAGHITYDEESLTLVPHQEKDGFEVIAEIRVDLSTETGIQVVQLTYDGKILAAGEIAITPFQPYDIKQGWKTVTTYADPIEDLLLRFPREVYVKVEATKLESGSEPERYIITRPLQKADNFYYYALGSYEAGDKLQISVYPDSLCNDQDVILPNKIISIRPGPVSIRSGFVFINADSSAFSKRNVPTIGLRTKIYQFKENDIWAISFGFSIGVQTTPLLSTFSMGLDYANLVGLSFGASIQDNNASKLSVAPSMELALDLRLVKIIVNKVF